ncbi:hypothetical protein [Streptomyces luteogriseus]|uniref:hypothetical protein n=1 Tax=Streptomyces luteogriseus TaxID=68233 RepID=UPI00369272E2
MQVSDYGEGVVVWQPTRLPGLAPGPFHGLLGINAVNGRRHPRRRPAVRRFNPHLLLKTLQQVDGPVVQMYFTARTKPVLLHTPDQADTFRGIVMPVRLHNGTTQPTP